MAKHIVGILTTLNTHNIAKQYECILLYQHLTKLAWVVDCASKVRVSGAASVLHIAAGMLNTGTP